MRCIILVFFTRLLFLSSLSPAFSFSNEKKAERPLSRREILTFAPIGVGGAIVYGKLIASSIEKFKRGDAYPTEHEQRLEEIITKSLLSSIPPANTASSTTSNRPLRVLEVGIGTSWRLERRGFYKSALSQLSSLGVSQLELTGIDIAVPDPNAIEDAQRRMEKLLASSEEEDEKSLNVQMNVVKGSITSNNIQFPDGYFDCVISGLTLCSVGDQDAAIQEIHRLVRPSGGTFGYIEHVAVDENEPYKFLEFQQQLLDPLQQAVADNCHLHRYTDDNIAKKFHIDDELISSRIFHERFLVDGMWPVSCQCCGVIQRNA